MGLFTMVFSIVLVVFAAGVATSWIKAQKEISANDSTSSRRIQELEQRLAVMEKRLANIETIATSKEYSLAKKFEELEKV